MDVKTAIETRRAYRSLDPVAISPELVEDLARCAGLAPSCFNKQPWRFVFVYDGDRLREMRGAMSSGNEWTQAASMIIAVCTKREMDCVMKDGREYALFDTGLATAFLLLRATELGLVAHPIAGYDPAKVRSFLGIPEDLDVVALVNLGRKSPVTSPDLPDWAVAAEKERPERLPLNKISYHNRYGL